MSILEIIAKLDISVVLGVVGILTGIVSLYLHWLNFRKNKPILEIEVIGVNISGGDGSSAGPPWAFVLELNLHNKGNSPTTVTEIRLNTYDHFLKLRPSIPTELTGWDKSPLDVPFEIKPNGSIKVELTFVPLTDYWNKFKVGTNKAKLDIELYHTHGKEHKNGDISFSKMGNSIILLSSDYINIDKDMAE